MDSNRQEITVRAVPWSERAAQVLAPSVPSACLDDLRAQVEAGAVLFAVESGGETVGFYILRIDTAPSGAEGVLVAAASVNADFDLTAQLLPHIEGQFTGCKSIRIHTARPGLAKKLTTRAGYQSAEIVLRKNLKK